MGDQKGIFVSHWIEPATLHVDAVHGNDDNDGLTRPTALASIQTAVDRVEDDGTILVWPGMYTETVRIEAKGLKLRSAADAAILQAPGQIALTIQGPRSSSTVIRHLVIRNSAEAVQCVDTSCRMENLTLVDNRIGVKKIGSDYAPTVTRCLFWNNETADIEGAMHLIYNWHASGDDDPLFADPTQDDYHLRSQSGRYWPRENVWVLDEVTSPCIDAGNPWVTPAAEPMPNGGRVNVGAHGNSAFASRSPWPLTGDLDRDGRVGILDLAQLAELWTQALPWSR
ncbi:MAG: hypothetical protein JW828_05140 [Sedimentisphaerales bacterium]|nr:hypothetical protein [Sedimentisphaerales bacterium]